jgi:hypothetical protein
MTVVLADENRNPSGFKPGDRVKVTGAGHRDFGKVGVIVALEGVEDDRHGKARAHISASGKFIHVSLPNLEHVKYIDRLA